MMKVTITVPEDYLGDIMGHVTSRRGRVEGMEAHGNSQIVNAMVPLAEMFGYATTLRSATQGRGTFMMVFDHYEDVPKSVQERNHQEKRRQRIIFLENKRFVLELSFFKISCKIAYDDQTIFSNVYHI